MIAEKSTFAIPLAEEYPQPSLHDVRRYLRDIGATPIGPGKGDHEKWRLPNGIVITLNAAKRQKNETDFASLKSIARALEMGIGDLTKAINAA